MAYCSNCGRKLKDKAKFCDACGTKVEVNVDEQIEENEENKEYIEYFCSHCNAVLNKQKGFNPKNNFNKCTNCGKTLFSDNVYSGERFPDTYWYCDKCNSLLNIQEGFSDLYNHWKCKKCGHQNDICDSEIYDSNEDYQEKKKEEKNKKTTVYEGEIRKCPNCGEILKSFASKCPSCGYELRGMDSSKSRKKFFDELKKCKSIDEKVETIMSFPVPNSKEDLLEFLDEAKPRILRSDLNNDGVFSNDENKLLIAWETMLDRCYSKAKKITKDKDYLQKFEEDITEINEWLDNKRKKDKQITHEKQIKEARKKFINSRVSWWLLGAGVLISIIFITISIYTNNIITLLISILMVVLLVFYLLFGMQLILKKGNKIFIIPLIISYLLTLPSIYFTNFAKLKGYEEFSWDKIVLQDYLPEISDPYGTIRVNNKINAEIIVYLTKEEYSNYVNLCKNSGYVEGVEETNNSFKAYNINYFYLEIDYIDEMILTLKAPYDMSGIILKDYLPEIKNPNNTVKENTNEKFIIEIEKESNLFEKYVTLLKNKGYEIEAVEINNVFEAYEKDGHLVKVSFDSINSKITIELIAPMKMEEITWSISKVAKLIPNPEKSFGLYESDSDECLIVYLSNFTYEEYQEYVEKCIEEGFDKNETKTKNEFSAERTYWFKKYELKVNYIGCNVVLIELKIKES